MGWIEDVVDRLAALKLVPGMEHDAAWEIVMREFPPRGRDVGPPRPLLFGGMEEEPLVDFMKRTTADAWYGRRPELRHLETALLDLSGTPGVSARSRTVAASLSLAA